ncbi:unnamed protein product [Vicia faba]|uniref:Uncharacterized protein n=1 Tax=Vicia faba TaxID=3906 RepID=A0AAV1B944_VICFA|nr:unnamed protein product [Vicia faba]
MAYPYSHYYIPYTPYISYQPQPHIISISPQQSSSTFYKHSSYHSYQPQSQNFYSQLETLKQYLIETHEIENKSREEMKELIQKFGDSLKATQERKLFDKVSHSSTKVEKEIFISNNVTNTSQPLLVDSSLNTSSEVELDPVVEKGTSFEDKEEMHVPCISNSPKICQQLTKVIT